MSKGKEAEKKPVQNIEQFLFYHDKFILFMRRFLIALLYIIYVVLCWLLLLLDGVFSWGAPQNYVCVYEEGIWRETAWRILAKIHFDIDIGND